MFTYYYYYYYYYFTVRAQWRFIASGNYSRSCLLYSPNVSANCTSTI